MTPEEKKELDEIKSMLLEIKAHFGIGKNVVRLIDIREKARKDVERAKTHVRKNAS